MQTPDRKPTAHRRTRSTGYTVRARRWPARAPRPGPARPYGGWARLFDAAPEDPEHPLLRRRHGDVEWHGEERRIHDRRSGLDRREIPARGGRGDRRRAERRTSLLERGRAFAQRFREPIIGLTIAGAAAPLVRAGSRATAPASAPEAARRAAPASAAATPATDPDAAVGAHWANAERDSMVTRAVDAYHITPQLAGSIYDHARQEGVKPDLAFGLVRTESAFDPHAISNVGARGLTQLMPRTARWLQPGTTASQLFHPETSLQLGFRYLRHLLDRYGGNEHLALLAYNRGPGTVNRMLRQGRDPSNGYARKVLGFASRIVP